ncbi:MAG: hypothetical protein ABI689_11305 [Thermoanaerobaculia bacterium]
MHSKVLLPTMASLLFTLAGEPLAAQLTLVFADGFESGNALAWSATVGEPALVPAEVYRLTDLDLRDPHLYVSPGFGCFDFTDQDIPLSPGSAFNGQLQAAITGDSEPDGLLDSSFLLEFRPFDETAAALRLDIAGGLCTAPMAGTSCGPDPASLPQTAGYDGLTAGSCLAALAGTTFPPYTPEVTGVAGPCFVSAPRQVVFNLNGVALPFTDLQLAGDWTATPVAGFATGLMRGFLSEAEAANVLLPASLPIVGGQPITVLLPGGAGNCAAHDDRDSLNGFPGWWFYFNFPATAVLWSGN